MKTLYPEKIYTRNFDFSACIENNRTKLNRIKIICVILAIIDILIMTKLIIF